MRLTLGTRRDFNFRTAVCSHGFFVLAPNAWDPRRGILRTAVTLEDDTALPVALSHTGSGVIASSPIAVGPDQRKPVCRAIRRMVRLDEDLSDFHAFCRETPSHRRAAELGFGRLLRSASLFEDMVKVICTCNVTWRQTVTMIDRIVSRWGPPTDLPGRHGFPTAARLARTSARQLREQARVGYRADFIHRLARDVADGRLDLDALETFEGTSDELFRRLRRIHGIGDYAAANLCMLLGRYDRLAVDTEMMRLLRQRHPRRRWTPRSIRACYERWHPYQFLAYWFELWHDYIDRHGQSDQWSPDDTGRRITTRR